MDLQTRDRINKQYKTWGHGELNRITGEYFAEIRSKAHDSDGVDYSVWKMTCVPAQRKF